MSSSSRFTRLGVRGFSNQTSPPRMSRFPGALLEADEKDLDAVEAHPIKRLDVKVLVRIGGKCRGELGS